MTKRNSPHPGIHIGKLRLRGRVLRDLIHGGGLPVKIDELDADADVGGDAVNSKRPKRQKRRRKRNLAGLGRKAITHIIYGAIGLGSAIAASGVAHALGW